MNQKAIETRRIGKHVLPHAREDGGAERNERRRTTMHEKDGKGLNDVDIETLCQHTGWAVFSGADGDQVHFIAYFDSYARAAHYIKVCEALDSESDYRLMLGDAAVVPAVIDPEDGTIMWANTGALEQGAEALCKRHSIEPYDASIFLKEAHAADAPAWSRAKSEAP
jgi:hypothetical protein